MRSKISFIVVVILQVAILFLFINSETAVLKSPERLVSGTKMVELQRFTDSRTLHFSYPMNTLSSMECNFEAGNFTKNHPIFVKVQHTDAGVKPLFFSTNKPEIAEGEILLKGKIESVASDAFYTLTYETKGKSFESKWLGKLSGTKKGETVMLALDPNNPEKIQYVSEWKEYQTRTPGTITRINPSVMNGQRMNELIIEFEHGGKKISEPYIQFLADVKKPAVLGAAVEVSFDEETTKILYVDFNPLVIAVISGVETGYTLQVNYGIETCNLQTDEKARLNELIDRFGDSQVSVEFAACKSGNTALTGIFIRDQKVALN